MIDWNGLALVLVGAVTSVIGGLALARIQRQHENSRVRVDKLEALLISTEQYVSQLDSHFMLQEMVMIGRITVDQMNDIELDKRREGERVPPYTELQTAVNLFFPSLHKLLQEVHATRSNCMDIFIRYKNIYVKVGPHSDWDPKQYRKSVQEFDAATKKFRQGIVDEANKITGGKAYYRSISDYG